VPDLEPSQVEVLVIGGGPAGYTAALRAADLGAKVVLIERNRVGGACLNYACIPTKFLRYAGEVLHVLDKAPRYGISAELKETNWTELQTRRQTLIDSQSEGLRGVIADHGIDIIAGEARLLAGREISVTAGTQEYRYRADKIIIATGSAPFRPDIPGIQYVMSSRDLLSVATPPSRLAIIGGGPVGVELATIFARFGTAVSLIEMMPHILPGEDAELAGLLERELKKSSVRLYTGCRLVGIDKTDGGYHVLLIGGSVQTINRQEVEVDGIAMCIGQKPRLDNISAAGLKTRRGVLVVDSRLGTSAEGIYAAGDITGKALLAYVAMMQGRIAAENALGLKSIMKYDAIPRCVFSMPELAGVGLTEDAARAKYPGVIVGRSPFAANASATIYGERRGLVKIVAEPEKGRLLGVHILGPGAPTLIHEAALALKMRATIKDIQRTLHIHPSLSEAIWEAAFNAAHT